MNKFFAVISLLLPLLSGCSEKPQSGELQKLPVDLIAGKEIAQKTCSGCHGMDGRGAQDNIPNLAAQIDTYLLKAAQTYDHGKRAGSSGDAMKITKDLSPTELRNVLGYYASLPPLGSSGNKSADYSYFDRGAALSKPCAGCHGADGNQTSAGVPRLAGQHPQYIVKAVKAYRDGTRTMPTMHEKLTSLSQADLENIAIYFALNKPKAVASKAANSYEGKQFTHQCAKCHGSMGSSEDASIPNLAGQDVNYLNTKIKAYRDKVRDHGEMHKILSEIKDKEIEKIAVFFAAEQPTQTNFIPPEPITALAQKCDLCHNAGNTNPAMLTPKLKGQNRTYLVNAMTAYRDGNRESSAMHKISSGLYMDATIEGIATHYSAEAAN
ncbi:MAG: c-type cytochrome [Gallionella sp.]|nr:c-type cytochrome [Gallionella sp.]